ncbi:hypothetical protein ABD71_10895 [Brevibacillus laterosporus]|nr:DUF2213 domain-containing protein [Brevibacillus laterosporus]MBG9773562.1 hypothetical protein [Brevibacillus laterosporus]
MTATPEGFLICHNVPIARTGWYEYLAEEIGAIDQKGKIVKVYRSPDDVFSLGAIASFEGKVLTDEHPHEAVTPDNATRYTKGVIQNVRQGSGENSDLLLADLVVYDQTLINEIQDGKREVSCGYDCTYEEMEDGTYQQREICGNHVAVVKSGRAGDRVAIQDSNSQTLENIKSKSKGDTSMAKKITLPKKTKSRVTDLLAAIGLKQFATDAEPEEIKEAVDALVEERESEDSDPDETKKETATDNQDPAFQALTEQVAKLTDMVMQLTQAKDEEPKPESLIDNAIAELEDSDEHEVADDEEESHTIPVEHMDEDGPVSDPEDRPQSALTGDNAYKIEALKAIKPIIAAIPDPAERKRATDAAIASIKRKPAKSAYATINKARRKTAVDSKPKPDYSQLGREIAKKYNPHYMKDRS